MQKKVNQVEEKAASLLMSSEQTKQERDDLKRKLLKAGSIEQQQPATHPFVNNYNTVPVTSTPSSHQIINSSTESVSLIMDTCVPKGCGDFNTD